MGKCISQPPAHVNPPSMVWIKFPALISSVSAVIFYEKRNGMASLLGKGPCVCCWYSVVADFLLCFGKWDGSLISQVQPSQHTPKVLVTTSLAFGIPQGLMFGGSFNVRAIIRIFIMLIMLHHSSYVYLCMGRYDNSV